LKPVGRVHVGRSDVDLNSSKITCVERLEDHMWTIQTPWFDVAVFMSLFSCGSILFGHFEQHKPAWRRLLKPVIFLALLVTLAQTVGRWWAYGVLGLLFCAAVSFHFVWLSKHGINGWTGEPKGRYLDLVGQTRAR
jgi:hypothetical protein